MIVKHKKTTFHQKIMGLVALKWGYRGSLKARLNWEDKSGFKSLYNKIGFKFKKLKNSLLIGGEYHDFEKSDINSRDLKLNTLTMKDNFCFFCSSGNYEGKDLNHIETYAYTTYAKGFNSLPINLKTILSCSNN